MPCPQDADLLEQGIKIDLFTGKTPRYFLLTHAHMDHMKGLTEHFHRKEGNGKIYCTRITADLAKIQVKGLREEDFVILKYKENFQLNDRVSVYCVQSYHCDGSCMFLFNIDVIGKDKNVRILYTGDFRFLPSMRKDSILSNGFVDRLYYDDTFDALTGVYDTIYPSYHDSYMVFKKTIQILLTKYPEGPIQINASVLGFEPILRELGLTYSLSKNLKGTPRGNQLRYLLPNQVSSSKSILVLSHRKLDEYKSGLWIIPTATYFLCSSSEEKMQIDESNPNHSYIWFSTHPNKYENDRLKTLICPRTVNPCGDNVKDLKCSKK
jgi:hypothetical protein